MQDVVVIIPTYNEIENIEAIIEAVFNQEKKFHILVVDDNSPDGTAEKVRGLQQKYAESLFLEVRHQKSGLRQAIEVLQDIEGISFNFFQSKDVVRHPVVARVVDAYESYEQQANRQKQQKEQQAKAKSLNNE